MVLVTDAKRTIGKDKKNEKEVEGYYMQGYLAENLSHIPWYLHKAWDVVGIVSGHGKVRIGKSTLAMQTAYYIAWMIAGGEMLFEYDEKGNPKIIGMTKPPETREVEVLDDKGEPTGKKKTIKNEVRFDLKENVVFSAEELQITATNLYKKYGKHQVIVYDEGRQGLDSTRAMESVNKGMQDFFQECGFMGHVILIVLPNFFKLHEDFAVARSLFLIDVFAKEGIERGYFNFYNEKQKELLYFFGKKKLGCMAKYASAHASFWGRFSRWLPFNKKEYEDLKNEAIKKKMKSRNERRIKLQRDILVWLCHKIHNIPFSEIADKLLTVGDVDMKEKTLSDITSDINELIIRQKGY